MSIQIMYYNLLLLPERILMRWRTCNNTALFIECILNMVKIFNISYTLVTVEAQRIFCQTIMFKKHYLWLKIFVILDVKSLGTLDITSNDEVWEIDNAKY